MLMTIQANQLLGLNYDRNGYLLFIFFSTLASYNLHWYYTTHIVTEKQRTLWSLRNKNLHVFIFFIGLAGAIYWGIGFIGYWWQMGIAVLLTFLYSAPKLPIPIFTRLKKIAIGKTLFLAFVWTYATTILPLLLDAGRWNSLDIFFCLGRFFFIYAVCIIFDYRDRETDRIEGIRSMITYFNEKGVLKLFYISLILSTIFYFLCYTNELELHLLIILIIPSIILPFLFLKARHDFSDYLYDFTIDGMMALSSLITALMGFF